jgi:hypothetical protein
MSKFPCTVPLTLGFGEEETAFLLAGLVPDAKMSKFSCDCSFNVPDNGAHSQEVVIDGAPALLIPVGSKPTDEQHHENEDLQKYYLFSTIFLCGLDGSLFKPREIRKRRKDDALLFMRTDAAKLRCMC